MKRWLMMRAAAALVAAMALPLTLHEFSLRAIRTSTFAAVRFAAIHDPAQLSQLPVSHWVEEEGVDVAAVRSMAWGRYEMHIPRTATTVVAEVDLRPTMAGLLLGAGGWLRVLAGFTVSIGLFGATLRRRAPNVRKKTTPDYSVKTDMRDAPCPMVPGTLMGTGLHHILKPSLVLTSDHRLMLWNSALQKEAPQVSWTCECHLLDLAGALPWGNQLLEAVDDHALHVDVNPLSPLLIIKEGDRVCVATG